MPHINRIRVNNVKYNFGTQSYDDFVMRMSGKNTIYDLANGGGKSVLMLLLLQNMIPNCTLDEKQPIEKLFRAGNDNKVIHSLVEWKLDTCHVKDGYIYMTTGFCARKAKEESDSDLRTTAPIEYFNYCIFYREVNPNDIVNLPLQSGDERITYSGLKNYLRDIAKKDYSLDIHIFDKKGEYQRFISQYGIYESEWELVRGINKTEGHVRTFFETHYKTTRKVVEDLFIEEIIEKSYKNNWENCEEEDNIAKTLLDIKDKLVELSHKKSEIDYYDHQSDALSAFCDRLNSMRGIYDEKASYEETLVKTYRSVDNRLLSLKDEVENDTEKLSEYNNKLRKLEKDIECAKISIEEIYLNELLAENNLLQTQNKHLEKDVKERENHLLLCEAANYYFEYVENEKQMKIQNNAILDITGKNGDLLGEIQALAFHLNKMTKEELQKEESLYIKLQAETEELNAKCKQLHSVEKDNHTQLAVVNNNIESAENKSKQIGQNLEELRQLSQLSLVEEAAMLLVNKSRQLDENTAQISELRERERSLIGIIAKLEASKAYRDDKLEILEDKRQEYKKQIDKINEALDKVRKMQEVYQESQESLYECVENAYETRIINLASLKNKKVLLEKQLEKLRNPKESTTDNMQSSGTDSLNTALKFIVRHYDENAKTGEAYLSGVSKEKQKQILKNVPYIGGCIVMNEHLQEASVDTSLSMRLMENESIILISPQALESESIFADSKQISVIGKIPYFALDEETRNKFIEKSLKEIEDLNKQINLTQDSIEVLKLDIAVIDKGLHNDAPELEKLKAAYAQVSEKTALLFKESEEFTSELNLKKDNLSKCSEKIVQLEANESQIRQEIELYGKIKNLLDEYMQLDSYISEQKNLSNHYKNSISENSTNINKLNSQILENEERLGILNRNIRNKKEQLLKYGPYVTNESYPSVNVDKSELEELFCGKLIALEEKNVDISDKQKVAQLYKLSMEKNVADIKYRGFTVEELEEFAKEGIIDKLSMDELASEKNKLERSRRNYEDSYFEYTHKQSQYDRQVGIVEHGRKSFYDKFQEEYSMPDNKQSVNVLQKYVSEGNARYKLAQNEGKLLKNALNKKERQILTLEALLAELKNLIESYEINMNLYSGMLPSQTDLENECKKIRTDYQRIARQEQKCRESFEKDKAQLIQTLDLLEAKDLSAEIQRQITNPSNPVQIEEYIENINETIRCIRLEKSRIGQSIEHMELMKENFVKQCLQTCVSIKEGLDRLPKLSNIQLDNQTINMLKLQIPYIDEQQFLSEMDNYITNIVENVESMETPAKRLGYIKNQLAWKRLFSVIVKDMDKIKLQLYKRERMKEQSRYLKYEEAVGSTGQSQGIYIQFLVSVINYISSMNSRNVQGEILRKVIFIDNPFGAAKDVYIWEPIFAMLKANHVQLIVPARGVTPAITGRFDVNYILGQKLVGNRQQTVVVDYRSQTQEDFLEYKELEYIQNTFEFYT